MGRSQPWLVIALLIIVLTCCPAVVIVAKLPRAIRPSMPDETAVAGHAPLPSPMRAETAAEVPLAADPTSAAPRQTVTQPPEDSIASPAPPSTITITMTEEELTSLVQQGLESTDIDGVEIHDPVVYITDEHIELIAVTPGPFGDMTVRLVAIVVAENGEVGASVTTATLSGLPLPRTVVLEIERGLEDVLSGWLPGGSELQDVILSDGQITIVVLP